MTHRRHVLKCWPSAYAAVCDGRKRFEYRRNDCDFAVGDLLLLIEWDPTFHGWANSSGPDLGGIEVKVTYLLQGQFGVPDGFCVMGISDPVSRTRDHFLYGPWPEIQINEAEFRKP